MEVMLWQLHLFLDPKSYEVADVTIQLCSGGLKLFVSQTEAVTYALIAFTASPSCALSNSVALGFESSSSSTYRSN
jgi:hypothetical protein